MKTPEQIISEIKTFISTSKPFRFSGPETTVLNLLIELENTLNPQPIVEEVAIEETVTKEPFVNETVVKADVVEETVVEDSDMTDEDPFVEEVIEETVTEKPVAKTTKKSKK